MMFKYVNEIRWQLAEQAQTYRDLEDPIMTLEVVITLQRTIVHPNSSKSGHRVGCAISQPTGLFSDHVSITTNLQLLEKSQAHHNAAG